MEGIKKHETAMDLASLQQSLTAKSNLAGQGRIPPVEKWNPAFCGDIDLVIKHDGSWHYMGTPIGRQALVRLFASVLKKEQEDYFLVTPVEKVGICVEDVPFVATQWCKEGEFIVMATSLGDEVIVSQQNPIKLQFCQHQQDQLPYVHIRRGLWARLHQNIFYQMVELGEETSIDGEHTILQLKSGDYCFTLGALD